MSRSAVAGRFGVRDTTIPASFAGFEACLTVNILSQSIYIYN